MTKLYLNKLKVLTSSFILKQNHNEKKSAQNAMKKSMKTENLSSLSSSTGTSYSFINILGNEIKKKF